MHNSFEDLIATHSQCVVNSKVATENGKRFEIDSTEEFSRIKIDGCLINSQQIQKCDFGFRRIINDDFYFVELKGKDIKTAKEQIISTINHFENNLIKIPKNKRFAFIISSKIPKAGTDVNNIRQELKKHHCSDIKIQNKVLIHKPSK